jgi:hydroxysqualene dehydroxylase
MAPQAGGRARGLAVNLLGQDRLLDNGQHLLIGAYTACQTLLADARQTLGNDVLASGPSHRSSPFLLQQAQPGFFARPHTQGTQPSLRFGRLAALDKSPWMAWLPQAGTALGLICAQGLSLQEKLAFVRFMRHLQSAHFTGFDGNTVLSLLLITKQPAGLIARVWEPLCVSALNTGVDVACAQTFVHVLQDSLAASPMLQPSGSVPLDSMAPASMALASMTLPHNAFPSDYIIPNEDLSRYFVNPVLTAFQKLGGQVKLRDTIRRLDEISNSQIVLALPPSSTAAILANVPAFETTHSSLVKKLNQFNYQSITTVYLAWDQAFSELDTGPYLLQEEPGQAAYGQWLFGRSFCQGVQVAAVVVSARGRYAELDTDTLSANIAKQVQRQTGLPLAKDWRAITEKRATFSCTPDRPKFSTEDLCLSVRTPSPKQIVLAGDYCYARYPATLESAVRSGLAAADLILQSQAALSA